MYKKLLFGLLGFMLITVMFSACRIIDASTIPHNPAVQMGTNNFIQPIITIKKGQKLDFVDTVAAPHVIANGKWNGTTQAPAKEAGAPDATASFSGSDTKAIGPFNTAGKFEIYCSIHQGMNLTVTVTS